MSTLLHSRQRHYCRSRRCRFFFSLAVIATACIVVLDRSQILVEGGSNVDESDGGSSESNGEVLGGISGGDDEENVEDEEEVDDEDLGILMEEYEDDDDEEDEDEGNDDEENDDEENDYEENDYEENDFEENDYEDYFEDYEESDEDNVENEEGDEEIDWELLSILTDEEILAATTPLPAKELYPRLHSTAMDALFARIEHNLLASGETSFGDFLDAGTGTHSLEWISSILNRKQVLEALNEDASDRGGKFGATRTKPCPADYYRNRALDRRQDDKPQCLPDITMDSFTAVTAADPMRRATLQAAAQYSVPPRAGQIIEGNWEDWSFLEGVKFDTILADYLIGAMDGYSPYFQDMIFHRLIQHLKPGGRIYVVGLSPIPDSLPEPENLFCKITKIRDACITLAGDRCYREYPLDWVLRQMQRSGLNVLDAMQYPILQTHETMLRQIDVGREKLHKFPTEGMAEEMGKVLDMLERDMNDVLDYLREDEEEVGLWVGLDYVVAAELPLDWEPESILTGAEGLERFLDDVEDEYEDDESDEADESEEDDENDEEEKSHGGEL